MIKVSVGVGSGSARFRATVRAENIRQAVEIVQDRYPGGEVRVVHPIDPETFFIEDSAAPAARAGAGTWERVAG